jgi:hypothetical protein
LLVPADDALCCSITTSRVVFVAINYIKPAQCTIGCPEARPVETGICGRGWDASKNGQNSQRYQNNNTKAAVG